MNSAQRASAPLLTDAQRAELLERLAHHRAHPDEQGITLAQLTAKLKWPSTFLKTTRVM
jgi:hypothetical protein